MERSGTAQSPSPPLLLIGKKTAANKKSPLQAAGYFLF
jgi:hypothetical protein